MHSLGLVFCILCLLANSVSANLLQARRLSIRTESIYPKKADEDAPYHVSESDLQAAINQSLPAAFTYGTKMPVLLGPGTANIANETFGANFLVLLSNSTEYDPVPLDIPGKLLNDIQINAEYFAYAINYISSISSNASIKIITFSQSSMDVQWAFKYWPSTRNVVSDFVAISADINGTNIAATLENMQGTVPVAPGLLQQEQDSVFVATLRNNGGASAYVPTTSIYTCTDQIVQPQEGTTASAYFGSDNGVAATNYEVQIVCSGGIAGGNYTHEGMLYNPFAYAIAIDAFENEGPGESSRLDLDTICSTYRTDGLSEMDEVATDTVRVLGLVNIAAYNNTVYVEPDIMDYASGDTPAGVTKVNVLSKLESLLESWLERS